jgi:hypothetical protein
LRCEYFGLIEKMYVSPRFSMSYTLSPVATLRAAAGLYHQSPGYEKQFTPGYEVYLTRTVYDLSGANSDGLVAEKAMHGVLGLDWELTENLGMSVEVYGKKLSDLIVPKILRGTKYVVDPIPGKNPHEPGGWSAPYAVSVDSVTNIPVNAGSGNAYGIEITIGNRRRAREDRISWALSYALSNARRSQQGYEYAYDFDRRHNFAIDAGWRITDDIELSARWTYGTGFPNSAPVGIHPRVYLKTDSVTHVSTPTLDTDFKGVVFDVDRGGMAHLNATRFPDYHRLDVRVTARPHWFGWDWGVYLEVINVYNRGNVVMINYAVDRDSLTMIAIPMSSLPVLPNIGVHIVF